MKNAIILFLLGCFLFMGSSCKKEHAVGSATNSERKNGNDKPAGSQDTRTALSGEWYTPQFQTVAENESNLFMVGEIDLATAIPSSYDQDIRLAFFRTRGREEYVYHPLPGFLVTSTGRADIEYRLDNSKFIIYINQLKAKEGEFDISANISSYATELEDVEYQWLVVPVELYRSLHIDWKNYSEVAEALELQ